MKNHNMIFYGTSAAEAIPNPFCDCYLCNYAREHGGRDVRTRTMFRVNEKVCIDMGADSLIQANLYGDFRQLEHVLVTHTHEDHLAYMMFNVRKMATHRQVPTLHFYLTDKAYDIVEFYRNSTPIMKGQLREAEEKGIVAFHKVEFFKSFQIEDMEVTAFRGNHFGNIGENSANYLIRRKDGTILYYGLDTGVYLEETFQALKGQHLDYLISECTWGNGEDASPNPGHLSYRTCMEVFHRLYEQHTIDENTRIYLTHINHCHTADHNTLQELFKKSGFPVRCTVAYDGMQIK